MMDLTGSIGLARIVPHPLAVRITAVAVFFLLLSLLLWRRGNRD
jgi:hypothetical protein